MKQYLILLIITSLIIGCKKNTSPTFIGSKSSDSLSFYLAGANSDSLPFKKKFNYNNRALSLIAKKNNDSINRIDYFKVANRYFNMNALKEYKNVTLEIIEKSKSANDTLSLGKAYSYMGDYYGSKFISESAYSYYFKAENLYKKIKKDSKIAKTILNKSVIQLNEKDYIGCEKSAFEALKYLKKSNDNELLYQAYNILGVIYNELSEYGKSIEYHNKALKIVDSGLLSSGNQPKIMSLNNIGLVYQNENKHKEAIKYFNDALKNIDHLNESTPLYVAIIDNLGYSEFKLKNNTESLNLFYKSSKISDSIGAVSVEISSELHLSEYYILKGDSATALMFADKVYTQARKNNLPKDILSSLKILSDINPTKAISYSKEYIRINDSLQLAERKIRNKLARIEFETDEIITQKTQLEEQKKTLIYITLGIILLAALIFIIRFQAAKNRELKLMQEQQKANEEIYQLMLNQQNKIEEVRQSEKKRIAQELHDGVLGKLFGTRMNLGVLNRKRDEGAEEERDVYIDELKNLEQEIREISHDLNSEKTAVFNNFVLMVNNFIETQRKVCQAEISFSVDESIVWNKVDNMAKINLYRILQEAFQNINKHANAKRVTVTFKEVDGQIKLNVEDNGVGFIYARKKKGIGMLNMKARITDSKGTMQVETEPGEGTILKFELPLNPT